MPDVMLVTGASSDVGRALLERFAETDAVVYAHHSRGGLKLKEQLDRLKGSARFVPVQADFTSIPQIEALIETVKGSHGCPNKIVHLAALPLTLQRFARLDWNSLQADFEISVRSITLILKAFLPLLVQAGRPGRVVLLLSSVTGGEPPKGFSAYTLVKFAQLGLMRALAAEFAEKRVCLNAVSPYTMETQFLAGVPHKFVEIAAARNPAGRNATPADVIPAIEFLLSDAAGFINGANIPITAGASF